MNDNHFADMVPPVDIAQSNHELWDDIVANGADTGVTDDAKFADSRTAARGIAWQFAKKQVGRKASKRGRSNQKKGKAGEKEGIAALLKMGHVRAVGIPTPKVYRMVGKGVYALVRTDRALGDINSMDENGYWCLSEVKNYDHDRLQWSALTRQTKKGSYHQSENLDQHLSYSPNVSAFLIWVRGKEAAVLRWPVDGFKKGTSIKWADALEMRVNNG